MSPVITEDARAIVEHLTPSLRPLAGSTVLVTGATGMVGQYVTRALLEIGRRVDGGLQVIALARNADKVRRSFADLADSAALQVVIGDVAEPQLPGPVTHIVHAASPARPDAFRTDPVGVIRANVLGAFALLELARRDGAYFNFISTMEVYGAIPREPGQDVVLGESDAGVLDSLDLRSAYPESKRLAENLCIAYEAQHGVRSDIVRLTHTYGPGMDPEDTRVQAEFLNKALSGQDIVLKSDGSLSRTYTYIADAASAVLYVLLTAGGRARPEAFNVADEAGRTTIRELAETVLAAAGREADALRFDLAETPERLWSKTGGGVYVDCSRARALGWSARYPLAEGIARTVRHHRESGSFGPQAQQESRGS